MTRWQYLKQILTKEQMQAVRFAKKYGYTIIVSGPQGPTGPTGPAGTVTAAAPVANATDSENVVNQFNELLANQRTAGLQATNP